MRIESFSNAICFQSLLLSTWVRFIEPRLDSLVVIIIGFPLFKLSFLFLASPSLNTIEPRRNLSANYFWRSEGSLWSSIKTSSPRYKVGRCWTESFRNCWIVSWSSTLVQSIWLSPRWLNICYACIFDIFLSIFKLDILIRASWGFYLLFWNSLFKSMNS